MIEEIKPVFLVKSEFEYQEKLKPMFSLEFSDFNDSDEMENKEFSANYLATSAFSSIEILMEDIEFVVAEN